MHLRILLGRIEAFSVVQYVNHGRETIVSLTCSAHCCGMQFAFNRFAAAPHPAQFLLTVFSLMNDPLKSRWQGRLAIS